MPNHQFGFVFLYDVVCLHFFFILCKFNVGKYSYSSLKSLMVLRFSKYGWCCVNQHTGPPPYMIRMERRGKNLWAQRVTKSPKQKKRDREAADPHPERLITYLGTQADHSCLEYAWTQADEWWDSEQHTVLSSCIDFFSENNKMRHMREQRSLQTGP